VAVAGALAASAAAHPTAVYSKGRVLAAFGSVGLQLNDESFGLDGDPTALDSQSGPGRKWSIAVYVYRKTPEATAAYKRQHTTWTRSGYAVAQAANLVVVVAPPNALVGVKRAAMAMPAQVTRALAKLSKR